MENEIKANANDMSDIKTAKEMILSLFENADTTEAEYSKVTPEYCKYATTEIMELFAAERSRSERLVETLAKVDSMLEQHGYLKGGDMRYEITTALTQHRLEETNG